MSSNPEKKHFTYSIRDFYKDYKKSCNKDKLFPKRPYRKYRDFIFDIFAEIFKAIIKDSWHFVLPYGLGEFYLKLDKRNMGKAIKYRDKYGVIKTTFNNHTLRKTFKFKWDKTYANFPNAKYYKFELLLGRNKLHKKYNVGKEALAAHYKAIAEDPSIKIPNPQSYPIRKIQPIADEN